MYDFKQQLHDGQLHENKLDEFFGRWYDIRPATPAEQRQGIDRHFTNRDTGRQITIEYKTDHTAGRTGNAFVETISVDTHHKPGWAHTSQAEILIYHIPEPETTYAIRLSALRSQLARWEAKYPKRAIPNKGYRTHGILVPLAEFERIALEVY